MGQSRGDDDGFEMPIRVVCCGNYFGKACLTRWYEDSCGFGSAISKKCPLCKRDPGDAFLDKLLIEDYCGAKLPADLPFG
jgi:hypothetical protein